MFPGGGHVLDFTFCVSLPYVSTIGLGATGAIAVNPHLPDAPPLKPERDLEPIGKLADIPLVFVTSKSAEYSNLQSFIRAARKAPGGLSYATAGQ